MSPYHLAADRFKWLEACGHYTTAAETPLFATTAGKHATKTAVADTFEALGGLMGQQLHDASGLRLFGGHTSRVTGAQVLAAAGIEINKIRILARHSGEAILRYVAEAPLRSLRADLGLVGHPGDGPQALPFMQGGPASTSALVRASAETGGIAAESCGNGTCTGSRRDWACDRLCPHGPPGQHSEHCRRGNSHGQERRCWTYCMWI